MGWVVGYPLLMAVVERMIAAMPEQIFAALADGWTYSDWVVGTKVAQS